MYVSPVRVESVREQVAGPTQFDRSRACVSKWQHQVEKSAGISWSGVVTNSHPLRALVLPCGKAPAWDEFEPVTNLKKKDNMQDVSPMEQRIFAHCIIRRHGGGLRGVTVTGQTRPRIHTASRSRRTGSLLLPSSLGPTNGNAPSPRPPTVSLTIRYRDYSPVEALRLLQSRVELARVLLRQLAS
jgi:hypothetical protein